MNTDLLFGLLREIDAAVDEPIASKSTGAAALRTDLPPGVQTGLRHMEERVDKLVLVCLAMWSLLRQTTNLTEDDLMERMRQIDLMDEKADGKVTRQVVACSKCKRVMSPRHSRCLYCGEPKLNMTGFDSVI